MEFGKYSCASNNLQLNAFKIEQFELYGCCATVVYGTLNCPVVYKTSQQLNFFQIIFSLSNLNKIVDNNDDSQIVLSSLT